MICPHCSKNGINFNRAYCWPYGTKICSNCGNPSKVKARPLLTFISGCLGLIAFVPGILFGSFYYLIAAIPVVVVLDYFMDKKFRKLVYDNPQAKA